MSDAPKPPESTRRSRPRTDGRRSELGRIIYKLIAENGLEGFRTRQVAEAAGIDTGTLHYHFPSKEAMIQAAVEHLAADFHANRASTTRPANALEEIRSEVRDVALRVRQSPEQFRVLFDLRVRAARDAAVAQILAKQDRAFHGMLTALLSRGVEQRLFRPDLDIELTASVLRVELAGLGFLALQTPQRIEEIAAAIGSQIEAWLCEYPGEPRDNGSMAKQSKPLAAPGKRKPSVPRVTKKVPEPAQNLQQRQEWFRKRSGD